MSDDLEVDSYEQARNDPLAAAILVALHKQDERTYNGRSGDMGRLALDTAAHVASLYSEQRP